MTFWNRGTVISERLLKSTKKHEGFRGEAYQDSEGVWTIGYGTNLQTMKCSEAWAEVKCHEKLTECQEALSHHPVYRNLSEARQDVLVEMAYNIGVSGLYGFKNMWVALGEGKYNDAAAEGMDSKWATQVGSRARNLMERLEAGI